MGLVGVVDLVVVVFVSRYLAVGVGVARIPKIHTVPLGRRVAQNIGDHRDVGIHCGDVDLNCGSFRCRQASAEFAVPVHCEVEKGGTVEDSD